MKPRDGRDVYPPYDLRRCRALQAAALKVLPDNWRNMSKKQVTTVAVHARIPESDVAVVDSAADEELISRSNMIARIVREWVKRQKQNNAD